jgi:hypothetical protein
MQANAVKWVKVVLTNYLNLLLVAVGGTIPIKSG